MHRGTDCVEINCIPVKEGQWRSYMSKFLQNNRPTYGQAARNTMVVRIAVTDDGVAYDTHLYPAENMTFSKEQSVGNGRESCQYLWATRLQPNTHLLQQ